MPNNSDVSRRKIMFGGVSLLAIPSLGFADTKNVILQTQNGKTHSLLVHQPGSGDYESLLPAHFPTLTKDATFVSLKPATVLLQNASSNSVRAASITWTFDTPEGQFKHTRTYFFQPHLSDSDPAISSVQDRRAYYTGGVKLLKKNAIRLFTPFFSWSPEYAASKARTSWKKALGRKTTYSFLLQQIQSASSVTASLETVIFGDNTIHGIDAHGLAKQYAVRRNAQHDAGASILKLIQANKSSHEIAELLLKQTRGFKKDYKAQPVDRSNVAQHLYYQQRTNHAKILLLRLIEGGMPSLTQTAQYLSKQKKHAISAVHA